MACMNNDDIDDIIQNNYANIRDSSEPSIIISQINKP